MKHAYQNPPSKRHYFVDEAGDPTVFDAKGRVIVGQEGCSRFFILGLSDIADPGAMAADLSDLRARLLADPYFRGVPSMQPDSPKTARAFHAKDDLPEVRREVFALLQRHTIGFFAVIRDKNKLVEYIRQRNERDWRYRYNPNELYDFLVRSLFKERLHQDDEYHICFARRGKADRTEALSAALRAAQNRFSATRGIESKATIQVTPASPPDRCGLQVTDYFLWSLQRLYERGEDRYVTLLWPSFKLVHDLDDTREAKYGVYYTQKKPLNLAAIKDLLGI